jgi:hypothetical protein
MADNISARQKLILEDGFLDDQKAESFDKVIEDGINGVMLNSAKKFVDVWKRVVKEKKIVASGNIESNLVILPPKDVNGVVTLEIELPYYAKFQDRGVKGLKKNPAQNSPYFFKTWGMSKEGQDSVREWLQTSKGKVSSSDAQKSQFGSETKFKKISDADSTLRQAIAGIKAGGIKTRNFIDPIVEEAFGEIGKDVAVVYGEKVLIQIFRK